MTLAPLRSPYVCPVCSLQMALPGMIEDIPTETLDPMLLHELVLAGMMQHIKIRHPDAWEQITKLAPIETILDKVMEDLEEEGFEFNGLFEIDSNQN